MMLERHLAGVDYLDATTTLLQRIRSEHPTSGLYDAAEMQFWWTAQRSTDSLGQLFWIDDDGRPSAAVIATEFGSGTSLLYEETTLVIFVLPDASPEWVSHVVERGLAHAGEVGIGVVELEVDREDALMRSLLFDRGFSIKEDGLVECWLDASARPSVAPLREGYRLATRAAMMNQPHHLAGPRRPEFEQRLEQLSLYQPDLDLFIVDADDDLAAYGLFWYDPVTATGLVEPMRTDDDHQGKGLGRHLLTAGVDRLAEAGALRIKIAYEPSNSASSHLYLSAGFEPHRHNDVVSNA